ncbi:unnamed protein product [Paramecium pentaurelia]|uniref:Uncharacterized protein n=1 Tax=Paramecium pentaurelia TaxID=43138 RepID=A0A8S1X4J8_9CILI|nr:unnamed protein product [Paramecium pentaurelia]
MKIILQYSGTNSKCLLTFNIINSLPLQFEIGQNIRLVQSIRSADPKRKGVEILREQCWMKSDIEKLREKKWSGLLLSQFLEMDKLSFDIKRYQNSYKIKGFYLQFPLLETLEQKTARADQVSEFIIYNKNSLLNKQIQVIIV